MLTVNIPIYSPKADRYHKLEVEFECSSDMEITVNNINLMVNGKSRYLCEGRWPHIYDSIVQEYYDEFNCAAASSRADEAEYRGDMHLKAMKEGL